MKMRTCSLGLATAVLLAASTASAAVAAVPSSGTQAPASVTTNSMDSGQRVIFFNRQGKEQSAQSYYAELWGRAALGG
jgi:hypothetical protein